jgi:hypothetical protein
MVMQLKNSHKCGGHLKWTPLFLEAYNKLDRLWYMTSS